MKLFDRLVKENAAVWDAYLHHDFVKQIESGTLPKANEWPVLRYKNVEYRKNNGERKV